MRGVPVNFELLAYSASLDVVLDEASHSWPPVIFLDGVEGLDFSGMSGSDFVMELRGDFFSQIVVFRNIILSLVEQDILSFELFDCPVL